MLMFSVGGATVIAIILHACGVWHAEYVGGVLFNMLWNSVSFVISRATVTHVLAS